MLPAPLMSSFAIPPVLGIVGRRRAADDTDPKRQNMGLATGGIVASGIALIVVAL